MVQRSPISVPKQIPALDGIRGFAVLLILAVHTPNPGTTGFLFPLGWMGVDLFFVLSGFLITRILLATRDTPRYFYNFYARRILRIWPLYVAILAFVFASQQLGIFHTYARTAAWICLVTFTQNIYIACFGWYAVPDWLEPTWSLGIEEQFYLIWPFLVRKLSRRALKIFCLATILVSPLLRLVVPHFFREEDAAMVLTFCRFDGLCFGTLLAIFSGENNSDYGRRLLRYSLPAFLGFLAIERWGLFMLGPAIRFSLLGISFTGLVALCSMPVGTAGLRKIANAIFVFGPLRFTGKISYCLYLSHTAVFALATSNPAQRMFRHLTGNFIHGWSQVFIGWIAAFIVAILSWYLFESPILRLKRNFEDPTAKATLAMAANG